jgi:hypothetical protein
MLYTFFWTLIGIPTGYLTSIFINDVHKSLYYTDISKFGKYCIITTIVFCSFLKGYTGNDLMTNICNYQSFTPFNLSNADYI